MSPIDFEPSGWRGIIAEVFTFTGVRAVSQAIGEHIRSQDSRAAERGVVIGRTWEILPNRVRITIGSREEMLRFRDAWQEVMREGVKAAASIDSPSTDSLQRFVRLT